MTLIPRISVTVDHHANSVKNPKMFEQFAGMSRFAIRADRVTGLIELMDGTVMISYLDNRGRTNRTYVEDNYSQLFTEIKDFATITE